MPNQICSVKASIGGGAATKHYFRASATLYTPANANDTGITPETDANFALTPLYDIGELMRVGLLSRIVVYVQGTGGKKNSVKMFCAPDKQISLLTKYNGDSPGTLNGKQVLGASSGVRRLVRKL